MCCEQTEKFSKLTPHVAYLNVAEHKKWFRIRAERNQVQNSNQFISKHADCDVASKEFRSFQADWSWKIKAVWATDRREEASSFIFAESCLKNKKLLCSLDFCYFLLRKSRIVKKIKISHLKTDSHNSNEQDIRNRRGWWWC